MVTDYRQFINRELPLVERACSSKVGFAGRREARTAAHHGRHAHGTLKPYSCRFCGAWHLGHPRNIHRPKPVRAAA
jgi:hypothetical protein